MWFVLIKYCRVLVVVVLKPWALTAFLALPYDVCREQERASGAHSLNKLFDCVYYNAGST